MTWTRLKDGFSDEQTDRTTDKSLSSENDDTLNTDNLEDLADFIMDS